MEEELKLTTYTIKMRFFHADRDTEETHCKVTARSGALVSRVLALAKIKIQSLRELPENLEALRIQNSNTYRDLPLYDTASENITLTYVYPID